MLISGLWTTCISSVVLSGVGLVQHSATTADESRTVVNTNLSSIVHAGTPAHAFDVKWLRARNPNAKPELLAAFDHMDDMLVSYKIKRSGTTKNMDNGKRDHVASSGGELPTAGDPGDTILISGCALAAKTKIKQEFSWNAKANGGKGDWHTESLSSEFDAKMTACEVAKPND